MKEPKKTSPHLLNDTIFHSLNDDYFMHHLCVIRLITNVHMHHMCVIRLIKDVHLHHLCHYTN